MFGQSSGGNNNNSQASGMPSSVMGGTYNIIGGSGNYSV